MYDFHHIHVCSFQGTIKKGYNHLHLNALYDLKNRIYTDVIIQSGRYPNETGALIDMMQRSKVQEPVLLITDRGYESYNVLTHAQEKGWKFLIRAKDLGSVGFLRTYPYQIMELSIVLYR